MGTLAPYAVVWLLVVFAWVTNYLVRMAFSALLPPIMTELDLSYAGAGVLATGFFYAYAAMQLPAGVLGDRFGRRRVLLLGLVGCALASALTGLSGSFAGLLAARVLTGATQGCLFSNDRAIIVSVTPPARMALGQAVSFTGPGLGTTLGLLVGGMLGDLVPWRAVFVAFALPPLVAAVLIARWVPAPSRSAAIVPLGARLRRVVGRADVWLLGLTGTAVAYVQFVLLTWAPLFFLEAGVKELGRAGLYASLQGIPAVLGLIAGGWLGDGARRRGIGHKAVIAGGLGAVTLCTLALAAAVQHGASPPILAAALVAATFAEWMVWGPSFALLGEQFSDEQLSAAFGLYNAIAISGAVIGPVVTGWARDLTGSFAAGCYVAAGVALAGGLVALLIRPAFRLATPPAAS